MSSARSFWRTKRLDQMTTVEWESLCDGCGRCCVLKLEDEDTGRLHYTDVACRLFDEQTCRCGNYAIRQSLVKGCVVLSPEELPEIAHWLPGSCAYRVLWEGGDLAWWHPLVSGSPHTVHQAGISMRGRVVPEYEVAEEDLEDHIISGDGWQQRDSGEAEP